MLAERREVSSPHGFQCRPGLAERVYVLPFLAADRAQSWGASDGEYRVPQVVQRKDGMTCPLALADMSSLSEVAARALPVKSQLAIHHLGGEFGEVDSMSSRTRSFARAGVAGAVHP